MVERNEDLLPRSKKAQFVRAPVRSGGKAPSTALRAGRTGRQGAKEENR